MRAASVPFLVLLCASCYSFTETVILDHVDKDEFEVEGVLKSVPYMSPILYRTVNSQGKEKIARIHTGALCLKCEYGRLHIACGEEGEEKPRLIIGLGKKRRYRLRRTADNEYTYKVIRILYEDGVVWEAEACRKEKPR